jgi:hypothetical protein
LWIAGFRPGIRTVKVVGEAAGAEEGDDGERFIE